MLVRDLMTPSPVIADFKTPIRTVMEDMHKHKIRHIPVVEDGRLAGMVSDRDIIFMHGVLDLFAGLSEDFIDDVLDLPISHIMQMRFVVGQDIIAVSEKSTVAEAIDLLLDHKLSALPVTSNKDTQEIVGILSYIDLLQALRPQDPES